MTDDEVRALLRSAIAEAADRHGIALDGLDCGLLARDLVGTTKEIVRRKRPIYRGPAHKPYVAAWKQRLNDETRAKADNAGQRWTGPEVAVALRDDLTVQQAAEMLGRSYMAVRAVRKKSKQSPRLHRLAFGGGPTP